MALGPTWYSDGQWSNNRHIIIHSSIVSSRRYSKIFYRTHPAVCSSATGRNHYLRAYLDFIGDLINSKHVYHVVSTSRNIRMAVYAIIFPMCWHVVINLLTFHGCWVMSYYSSSSKIQNLTIFHHMYTLPFDLYSKTVISRHNAKSQTEIIFFD